LPLVVFGYQQDRPDEIRHNSQYSSKMRHIEFPDCEPRLIWAVNTGIR